MLHCFILLPILGIGVPILTLAILYFDVKVPNELKGFIFYAQVSLCLYLRIVYLNLWQPEYFSSYS